MAQDDFLTFIERIKQAESRGQRYDSKGNLLTSPKGAQGEMQVMPATQRAPGFGVAPVKNNSPDEIARVGRDILRAFDAKYGGNRMYIAAAYNWGPGNADKWIAAGADFNKLPEETQKYLRKVVPEALTASRDQKPAPRATAVTEPAVMEPPPGISASAGGKTIAIGDSLAVGFAQANKLDGLHKGGAGPKAVLKMVQDYAANNNLEGVTVYLGTGLPNNPAQRDFVTKQVDLIKSKGGIPVLFGAGPGSEKTPTTGQNEFLQSVAQSTGAKFTGPLADRFPNISKQDRTGLHLTHPQYRQLFSQMGGAAPVASRPAAASPAPGETSTAAASAAAPAAVAAAPVARSEDLGSGYKAALALSFLGSEDRDRPTTDSELEDRLNETALAEFNKELEDYTPKNALADVELTALNPAKFMQPVKMADGGEVKGQSASKMLRELFNDDPVNRSNGSPETGERALTPEEIAAASRPATFNPNIARQGAAARALAAQRDVNTLPDPRTYAAVSGFFGQAPDELGFSAMHPDIKGITAAGEAGYAAGLVPAVAPVVAPIARAVGKGATALGMRAEKALDAPVTRTLEGGGRSAEMLRALGAQPSYAVRPKGGHFELRPDKSGPGMAVWDDVKQTVSDLLANTKDQPLNNWFNTKYATYLRRDFAAEGDPFVKAADAGKKLHIPNQPLDEDWQTTLNFVRKREGLPSQGFATTPYGKNIEDSLDASLNIRDLGDLANSPYSINRIPPGIRQFANTNPQMRVYSLDEIMETGPRAESLRNTMLEMRQPSVSYYGESIAIPKNYQLTNETLQGLTPVQASERAALFSEWKDTARQKAATLSVRKNKDISKQDAGDGYLWVNPPDLNANPKIRQLVQDVGCDGGWCTREERFAMNYGSGNSRLSFLIDNKNRPVAQMTIEDLGPPDPKDFIKSLSPQEIAAFRSNPLYRNIQDDELHLFADSFPQYDQYVRNAPPRLSITELKARGNKADVVNTVSSIDLRKIQDQVKNLDARLDLQYVQNLKGIGMTDLTSHIKDTLTGLNVTLSKATSSATLKEASRLNGGSSYINNDPKEINRIIVQAYKNITQPPVNRAKGGMVERTYNENRAYL